MQTKELLDSLKSGLSTKLGPAFKAKTHLGNKNVRHERAFAGGKMVVSQNVAEYNGTYALYLSLMVHHDEVENLYGKALGLAPKIIALRGSLFLNQATSQGKSLHGFQVQNSTDVDEWLDLIVPYIHQQGEAFWSQFDSLDKIHASVNSNIEQELPWFADQRFRAEYGLVVAKVLKHPDYENLLHMYRQLLQHREDYALFELVADALN